MEVGMIISILGAAVTLGTVLIGVGVLKGRLNNAVEINLEQSKKIEVCATRDELASAIRRSDEMLEALARRVEEDRIGGERWRKEFLELARGHGERIAVMENMQGTQTRTLDKLEGAVNLGFKELREDLKELQKRITERV
ncbi:MAG: hypothetical protein LBC77_09220 [Spirochaetaceae bacterium]|jgi:hypothetical protein|nr:hypothetical protein [Spirochaetaceae bacterium]